MKSHSFGVVESTYWILWERAMSLRLTAGLEEGFWVEAISMAIFLINRTPSIAIDMKIPKEVWKRAHVDYSFLKVFSYSAYLEDERHNKLNPRGSNHILLGYREGMKKYR